MRLLPTSFYESTITLIPKPKYKNTMHNIFHENRCKSPQQNISKFHPTMYEIIIPIMIQQNLSKGMQG